MTNLILINWKVLWNSLHTWQFSCCMKMSGWSHIFSQATFYHLYSSINYPMLLASCMCKDCDVWYVCAVSADPVYGLRGLTDREREREWEVNEYERAKVLDRELLQIYCLLFSHRGSELDQFLKSHLIITAFGCFPPLSELLKACNFVLNPPKNICGLV